MFNITFKKKMLLLDTYENEIYNNTIKVNKYTGISNWIYILIVILIAFIVGLSFIIYLIQRKLNKKNNANNNNDDKAKNSESINIDTSKSSSKQFSERKRKNISNIFAYQSLEKMENPMTILFKIKICDKLYILADSNTTVESLCKFYCCIKNLDFDDIKFYQNKRQIDKNCKDSISKNLIKNNNEFIYSLEVEISNSKCPNFCKKPYKFFAILFGILQLALELICLLFIALILSLSSNNPLENNLI